MNSSPIPKHVGFILDGNRRWAKEHGVSSLEGHKKGYENLKSISEAAFNHGADYVSAYIFSTENWNRSKEEVGYLMNLVVNLASNELNGIIDKDIKIVFLGTRDKLSQKVIKAIESAENKSKSNKSGTLALCFNYGGKEEIISAAKRLANKGTGLDEINEDDFEEALYHSEIPPLDFIIRTSGEKRLSNFMLWRAAYSELYFVDKHWPAFSPSDLEMAFDEYANRKRRFGK